MRIAVLGATSQIARDFVAEGARRRYPAEFLLYARDTARVGEWQSAQGLAHPVAPLDAYGDEDHDAVINFIGVGDPSRAAAMGSAILDITTHYDHAVTRLLEKAPGRRYIFLSSGAVYGTGFQVPATIETPTVVNVNSLAMQEFYTVAKLHAEARHRAMASHPIVDIRVFNYFSRTLDLGARFFVTDVIRAVRDKAVLPTNSATMTRDFLHPQDFFGLVASILEGPPKNGPVDAFSQAPVEKFALLERFKSEFALRYEVTPASDMIVNATGAKPQYFSRNTAAKDWFGYRPAWSSLDGVLAETRAIFERLSQDK